MKKVVFGYLPRAELFQFVAQITQKPGIAIKAVMITFLVSASGLASYLVIGSCVNYLAYDVITTWRTVFETPTLFPKVTVCDWNMFNTAYGVDIYKMANLLAAPTINVFDPVQMAKLSLPAQVALFTKIYVIMNTIASDKSFSDTNRLRIGSDFAQVLLDCKFNNQKCDASDFVRVFDATFGNCHVFNSGFDSAGNPVELKKTSVPGPKFGLQLKLFTRFNDLLRNFNLGVGAQIRIDNSSYLIDHIFDGYSMSAGFHTDVSIDRAVKYYMPKPYSMCEVDANSPKTANSELYNLIAASQYEYRQQMCLQQCLQRLVIRECNCTASPFVSLFNASFCSTVQAITCGFNVFYTKYSSPEFLNANCLPLCPLECNNTQFSVTTSSHVYRGDSYVNYIKNNSNLSAYFVVDPINVDTVSSSIASFSVFYESLSYSLSYELPQMDVVSLLASIGGNLNLFLAVSALSVCELVEIGFEVCAYSVKKRKH